MKSSALPPHATTGEPYMTPEWGGALRPRDTEYYEWQIHRILPGWP